MEGAKLRIKTCEPGETEPFARFHRRTGQIPPAIGSHELNRELKPTCKMFSDERLLTPMNVLAAEDVLKQQISGFKYSYCSLKRNEAAAAQANW
jgi:hypothetical protein